MLLFWSGQQTTSHWSHGKGWKRAGFDVDAKNWWVQQGNLCGVAIGGGWRSVAADEGIGLCHTRLPFNKRWAVAAVRIQPVEQIQPPKIAFTPFPTTSQKGLPVMEGLVAGEGLAIRQAI